MVKLFKITHYLGKVEAVDRVLKEEVVESESIKDINPLTILNDSENKIKYLRCIIFDPDKCLVYDYGPYTKFIKVELLDNK